MKDGKLIMSQLQKMFPKRINIQTQAGCNARCVFCPSHQVAGKIPMGKMDWPLFKKIVDECALHEMSRVNPFSQNEPLIDKEIAERVAYIKEKCGDRVTSLIISNGSLLTEQLMHDFIDAGLDRLKISLQGLTKETYEEVMVGLKHDVTYANVERAVQILKDRRAKKPLLSVSTVTTGINEHEIRKWKRYWRRQGVKATASPCENRGGNIASIKALYPYGLVSKLGCKRPSQDAIVAYNGDVLICCVDWWRTVRLGNLREQTLEEIWNCEEARKIRQAHAAGDAAALPKICRDCKVSYLPARQHISLKGLHQRYLAFKYRRRADRL
jgi:radical SAM protein with 4Fe4S-binding SPASM domain